MNINYLRKKQIKKALYERDGGKCHYCGIEEKDFIPIWGRAFRQGRRGLTLEVDRKNPKGLYIPSNCVLACYACNNAKSDVFTYEEFKRVGDVIKEIYQQKQALYLRRSPQATGTVAAG
ncbi:hypothetical protein ES708_30383 [subsurface metagenome]